MRNFVLILILLGFSGSFLFWNYVHALWVPMSPEQLLDESGTIFVGTITAITPVEVEYQSQIARNGTIKQSVGSEVMTLEEYTIHIEQFLQNPQDTDTLKLLQATVSGVPGGPAKISGYKTGDRVLFYVPKNKNQTHFQGQYLPESFKIPEYCDAQSVLGEPTRISEGPFIATQDGVKKQREFNAFTPIQFSYQKKGGLSGNGFDVLVSIVREHEGGDEIVFDQIVHAESERCKWLATAKWEIVPAEGKYRMSIGVIEDGLRGSGLYTNFVVRNTSLEVNSPLQQFNSGIQINEIQCKEEMVLITKSSDGSPACVKPETKQKLIERGWAKSDSEGTHLTPIITELGKIGTYELQRGNKAYDIPYHIKGGSDIEEIFLDENSKTLNVVLKQHDSGSLEITLSRELIDAKISEDVDDLFFVLIDGEEVPYDETTSETSRTLTIQFEKESKVIEIIGVMPI